jgi:hypothetical protein
MYDVNRSELTGNYESTFFPPKIKMRIKTSNTKKLSDTYKNSHRA